MQEFPRQVEKIANKVRVLDGSNNKIRQVPDYVQVMVHCNRIGLSKNRISSLPPGVSALVNLRVLLLDNNRFKEIPTCILNLPKLERLNLSNNLIAEIPCAIEGLKSLKSLDISHNNLVKLPRSLGKLQRLEEFHASGNALERLPVELAKLEKLRLMVVENNKIQSVPSEVLLHCVALQTLALHGNPLTIEQLRETKGYEEFEARRKAKWDKSIAGGVLLGPSRFDEGADRKMQESESPRIASHNATSKDKKKKKSIKSGSGGRLT